MKIRRVVRNIEIDSMLIIDSGFRDAILASLSSRDIVKDLVRVKSSNVWSRMINIKDNKAKSGDVYVQFKGERGGPGDIYVYYDVPIMVYRKWLSATSVGHYFWKYIRNNYKYAKLTGDKKTHLKWGINYTPSVRHKRGKQL